MSSLNEQDQVYSEAHAKELLNLQISYNQKLKGLNDELAKKKSDLAVKYMKLSQSGNTQPVKPAQTSKSGTVDTTGNPVNADGSPVKTESYKGLVRIKQLVNEEEYDTRYADSEVVQDLKNYMDAENISYIEDEDETTLEFDKSELDLEWEEELDNFGLEELNKDVNVDDVLDIKDDKDEEFENDEDEEFGEESDVSDIHDEIDEKKVFYVRISDDEGDFTGKIYKLFDDGDWRAKVIKGSSETFEKLNYDPTYDEFDIVAFLRENYDNVDLISKEEFDQDVESSEIKESHKIQTFEEFLNESK